MDVDKLEKEIFVGGCVDGYDNGFEYQYQETGIQTAGTMDHSPSAAGIAWRANVRIQVQLGTAC